jgi:NhaP-type Na+/H+ or K+/H+ antiporter
VTDFRTLVLVAIILAYALLSRRLQRWWISMPMVMVILGFAVGPDGLGVLDMSLGSELVKTIAEVTLALMLFRDAVRIDLRELRKEYVLPVRLLAIGLPLMIVLGTGAAVLLLPGIGLVGAALLATMLAPTDAALGEAVVSDKRLPVRLRQGLNVESGLNDGLSVPVFLVLIAVAVEQSWHPGSLAGELGRQIGYGILGGVVCGGGGGLLVCWAAVRRTMDGSWQRIGVLLIALATYVSAAWLGGSGFIGAFVGGLAFAIASGSRGPATLAFTGYVGTLFDTVSFVLFGALLVPLALQGLTVPIVLYALVSLLVIRLVSVVISMAGSGVQWPTLAFMGWFGPRGLATVVFTLLLLDEQLAVGPTVAAVAIVGVAISVYAHGFTAPPLAGLYARWFDEQARVAAQPLMESAPAPEHPVRSDDRGTGAQLAAAEASPPRSLGGS